MKRLTKNLADFLIEEELVRTPYMDADVYTDESTGETYTLPVIFVEVDAPSPNDLKNIGDVDITLTLQSAGGRGTLPYQGFLDRRAVDLLFRCNKQNEKKVLDLSNKIDFLMDDKRAWQMANIRVEIAQLTKPIDFVPYKLDDEGSMYYSQYQFLTRKIEFQN
jgi:hypothetical protein